MATIDFTSGDDTHVQTGGDVLIATILNFLAGNDTVHILDGAVVANMGDGDDFVSFDGGYGWAYGEAGNDWIRIFANVDAYGGEGNDRIDVAFGISPRTIDGGVGNDLINVFGGYSLRILGGDGNDRINFYGDVPREIEMSRTWSFIDGGDGADTFFGYGHRVAILTGGAGNDRFYDFAGGVSGGLGDDLYRNAVPIERPDEGIDTVQVAFGTSYQLPDNVENLAALGFADLGGPATLRGNALNNRITGGSQNETLFGYSGNDRLYGNGGADALSAGDGSDWIEGGAARDQLHGGAGADSFVFRNGDFAGLTISTCDVIRDFGNSDGDRIRLNLVDANQAALGDQAFTFIGAAAFTGQAGQLRYQQISGNTYVQGDVSGDGVADFWIRLDGLHALGAGDFIL